VFLRRDISKSPSMFVGDVPPNAPRIGQPWHQIGVKLEKILQWDGADWVIDAHVVDYPSIGEQGKRVCDFKEALACARGHAKRLDCEFIYTYGASTSENG
jgi:hypothetical protein